ncbi:MAG: Gfo/Idh/MocA family oxidoreductase [Verrucomicrobiota bacterium]
MGEADDSKKQHVIFGSAGMAAAGMMPGAKARSRVNEPKEELPKDDVTEGPDEVEEVEVTEEDAGEISEESIPAEFDGLKAAIVGFTGSGGFGNGMELLFQRLDKVRLFGLADLNGESLEASRVHAGSPKGYSDLGAMLQEESPDLVSVAALSTEHRLEQIKTALQSGSHVITEAPLAQTLKEADELLGLSKSSERQIAVRHPMRVDPHLNRFHAEMTSLIGELLEMRVWGACDETSGGEDMLLVGIPLFDLVRWFAGEVSFCTASISEQGVAVIAEDAHESATPHLGRLLGDSIHAEFEMESGVRVSFVSDQKRQPILGPAGIEFIGSKSKMRLFAGAPATLSLLTDPNPAEASRTEVWEQWPADQSEYHVSVDQLDGRDAAHRLLVHDWISAIESGGEPSASAETALKALEMAHGVWQAGVTMKRAYFPLANRLHPLSEESQ